jgi:zinc transporter ZupT
MAGRNLGEGIAVALFTYWRDERALGAMILCLLPNGLADTYILVTSKEPVHSVWLHVMNIGIATVVGTGLLGWW